MKQVMHMNCRTHPYKLFIRSIKLELGKMKKTFKKPRQTVPNINFKKLFTKNLLPLGYLKYNVAYSEQHKSKKSQNGRHRTSRKSAHYHLMFQCAPMPVAKCSHGFLSIRPCIFKQQLTQHKQHLICDGSNLLANNVAQCGHFYRQHEKSTNIPPTL